MHHTKEMNQFVCSFPLVVKAAKRQKPVAWGVSPRNRDPQLGKPRKGRQKESVAPSVLEGWRVSLIPWLTPRAISFCAFGALNRTC